MSSDSVAGDVGCFAVGCGDPGRFAVRSERSLPCFRLFPARIQKLLTVIIIIIIRAKLLRLESALSPEILELCNFIMKKPIHKNQKQNLPYYPRSPLLPS